VDSFFLLCLQSLFFLLTSVLCDIAGQLGCFILCKDILTGFILLSIGLNIPNLVAAKIAAAEEESADLPLICLLAGNCFITSLGFGLSWLLGSIYWEAQGHSFNIPVGSLGFCITSFFFLGLIAFIVLYSRRRCSGGELGGNLGCKVFTTIVFFILWVILVVGISMEAYGYINSGF
jgi:solute carrier family 8 (sodium/calcium exchanger)